MIRGTTPLLEFDIPFDTSNIAEAFVTLSQNREVILDKPLSECKCSSNKISVRRQNRIYRRGVINHANQLLQQQSDF